MNFGKIDITATFFFRICETPGDFKKSGRAQRGQGKFPG